MKSTPYTSFPGKTQRIAIALMIAVGIALGALILGGKPGKAGAEDRQETQGAAKAEATEHHEEGMVELNDAQIKAAHIGLAKAGPAQIKSSVQLPGEIRLNEDRTAHVVPRVAGVVERAPVSQGQVVKKGQVLAVLVSPAVAELRGELSNAQSRLRLAVSNHAREKTLWQQKISAEQDYLQAQQALQEAEIAVSNARQKLVALGLEAASGTGNRFELRAPFAGTVLERHLTLGEALKEDASAFTIADLGGVWAEISVAAKDLPSFHVGDTVSIKASGQDATASGKVIDVGALMGEQTRMAKVRVALANPDGSWRPGMFVSVELNASSAAVPVAVAADALQSIGDQSVVFVRVDGGFKAQPVVLGRRDAQSVEVLQGLSAGTAYAASGSFVLKSELGKGSAEHSH